MAVLTIRNLPDEVHRALRMRAARHGRSTEAEVRSILANTVMPDSGIRMGQALASLGRRIGMTHADCDALEALRDSEPAEPMGLE